MPLEDEFGDIVQKARQGLGISTAALAAQVGIGKGDLDLLEACSRDPEEGTARRLAQALGLDADKLWVTANKGWHPKPASHDAVVTVSGLIGNYPVNGYLLVDEGTKQAAAVDTANDPEALSAALQARGLNLQWILLTHTHQDHMGGVDRLRKAHPGATLAVHQAEQGEVAEVWRDGDKALAGGERIAVGTREVQALFTPGHTAGGTTYVANGVAFVGDTLFAGSLGRANDSYARLLASVRQGVMGLADGTILFPGHGPATTVGEEKAHNPCV